MKFEMFSCSFDVMATEFTSKVIALIAKIPNGKVATYGQIAELAGKPHAARGVSWILHSSSKTHKLPWHRVLGSKGRISFPKRSRHYLKQLELLAKEGVEPEENSRIDLDSYQWRKPRPKTTKTLRGRRW